MQPSPNTPFDFVIALMNRFAQAQIMTWLCGGWAEELWGMCAPRHHRDVDLLYPAPSFAYLDQWLALSTDLVAIPEKKFSHKRAFLSEGIMIEVILLESGRAGDYLTNLFDGRYQIIWPQRSLHFLSIGEQKVPVASRKALQLYRHHHPDITKAYYMYLQESFD